MKYRKPPLPFCDQVKLLQDRGLVVTNVKHGAHVLEHINYYRLSAYFLPFQSAKDRFDSGTTFEDILYLYEFDRKLRNLLMEGLARIEVAAKTQIAHHLAMKYGAFAYVDSELFNFRHCSHAEWLDKVRVNIGRTRETFKKHFFDKYDEENYLPIWMAVELMTFGQVSQLYNAMGKKDRQDIARGYFKVDQRLMTSWLHVIVYIRNLCAHHSRIWNRELAIRPLLNFKDKDWENIDNGRLFSIFLLIKKLLHFRDKWDEWSGKLLILLGDFSKVEVGRMGFPGNWREILVDHLEAENYE